VSVSIYEIVDFGNSYAGIPTVGYRVYDSANTLVTARTTAGVVEIGVGKYAANILVDAAFIGSLLWDTDVDSSVNAITQIDARYLTFDADGNLIQANPSLLTYGIPTGTLVELANAPASVTVDGRSVTERSAQDIIAFDKHLAGRQLGADGWGAIGARKMIPPGARG
jgi:hypothetical protein